MSTGSIAFPSSAARNLKALGTAALLFVSFCVNAQEDTLQTKTFNQKDITAFDPVKEKVVSGANRITENPDELAVRTYIITRDEIIRNGYISLNDVLRTLPGFRISEPSNAYIGESFLMRGLTGNMYTKILINGIAITPSAAPGFPLGSNLPIRQAERIEIILGPASTIYGSDAMAGVINIVIPEVERPVEALAGVSAGTKGRNEFNLFLGGKAGNAKNVLQYQLFGSSVSVPDRNLNLNDDLMRVDTNTINQKGSPANYVGLKDKTLPLISALPHESRLIGSSLKFKDFRLIALQMYRKDHSAIGSHPEVVAYNDPNSYIADQINSYQLQYDKSFNRLMIHTNINANNYRVDNTSSYIGITHPLANGKNYFYAWSRDVFVEQLVGYRMKHLSFLAGVNMNKRRGIGYQSYLARPYDANDPDQVNLRQLPDGSSVWVVNNSSDTTNQIAPGSEYNRYTYQDYSAFLQAVYKTEKLNINLGVRFDRVDTLYSKESKHYLQTSPRVGVFYKINNMLRIRGMYAQAFRMLGGFYTFNNYRYESIPNSNEPPNYKRISRNNLKPELMQNLEGGIVFTPLRELKLEFHYFAHQLMNSITLSEETPDNITNPMDRPYIGYAAKNSSTSELQGFELFVHYENKYFTTNLAGQYNIGKEKIDGIDSVDFYRSVPKYQLHAAVLSNIKAFRISLYANYFSDFSGALIKRDNQIFTQATDGYLLVDGIIGNQVSKRLYAYIRVKNAFNADAKGISTPFITGKPLNYIPQEKRAISLGMTFSLN
jgi:outer membrane cobalamin receptor